MSEHTPGPWTAAHVGGNEFEVWGEAEGGGPEDRTADARLIAAAPALLEACQLGSEYDLELQSCGADPDRMTSHCTVQGDDLDTLYAKWINATRAAIAAATGQEVPIA